MITCLLKGGLGNQLFQIFMTIAYAKQNNHDFFFLEDSVYRNTSSIIPTRSFYWSTLFFFLRPHVFGNNAYKKSKLDKIAIKETTFHFKPVVQLDNMHKDAIVVLDGYFQSPKYFLAHVDFIFETLNLKDIIKTTVNKYKYKYGETISMHFRWGDYKYLQTKYVLLCKSYYSKALKTILNELGDRKQQNDEGVEIPTRVLCFCEKDDFHDISEQIVAPLSEEFPTLRFQFIDRDIPDWEQLLIMSHCAHNIIANSTFSWWGGFFNSSQEKIVVAPRKYFGPEMTHSHSLMDFYPPDWKLV